MENGQISAPGSLQAGSVVEPEPPRIPDEPLDELAARFGLKLSGARPTLRAYLRMLWDRRHFIVGYATARNVSMYTDAKLGQVWQILTPLLNAGVYYLIFGLLFETSRAVIHFPAFLMVGVFVFAFTERAIVTGSNVMRANISLIRALYFPRASLPLAYVIVELQQMLIGMGVIVVVMLISGEYPSWYWFLVIPAVVLQTLFNTGAALIVARLGGAAADVSELIPFFLRISRYFCGVMYLVYTVTYRFQSHGAWVGKVLSLNPAAVYISLVRVAFMGSYRADQPGNAPYSAKLCTYFLNAQGRDIPKGMPGYVAGTKTADYAYLAHCAATVTNNDLWIAAAAWGVLFFLVGIVFFWRAENKYGRG